MRSKQRIKRAKKKFTIFAVWASNILFCNLNAPWTSLTSKDWLSSLFDRSLISSRAVWLRSEIFIKLTDSPDSYLVRDIKPPIHFQQSTNILQYDFFNDAVNCKMYFETPSRFRKRRVIAIQKFHCNRPYFSIK